jgi:hypothetical protein
MNNCGLAMLLLSFFEGKYNGHKTCHSTTGFNNGQNLSFHDGLAATGKHGISPYKKQTLNIDRR